MATKTAPVRSRGGAANARRILRELILIVLAQTNGRAQTSEVLRSVRKRAEEYVPREWQKPHPPYRSRIELYVAFERASLRDAGLLDATQRGIWKLSKAGWNLAEKLTAGWNEGRSKPKVSTEALTHKGVKSWLGRVAGSFRDEPDFDTVLKLGR